MNRVLDQALLATGVQGAGTSVAGTEARGCPLTGLCAAGIFFTALVISGSVVPKVLFIHPLLTDYLLGLPSQSPTD